MLLPLRLIWNLQIPVVQKISIGGIFGVGLVCVITATIRVVQIGVESGSDTTPSSSWLAFWAIIEASIGNLSLLSLPRTLRWMPILTLVTPSRHRRMPPLLCSFLPQHPRQQP
jgi:hypothetical protein